MNKVLYRFRKRNIQANIYNFLLVIFVVAVSVCLICGLFINYFTLDKSINSFFKKSNLPSAWIETNQISADDETFFENNFNFEKRLKMNQSFNCKTETYDATFLISNGKLSTPYIVDGQKASGCYVDAKFAEKYNLQTNFSKITFNYTLNGVTKEIEFKVVGTISMAENFIAFDEFVIFIDENVFVKNLKNYFTDIDENDLSILNYNQILIKGDVTKDDVSKIQNHYETSSSNLYKITLNQDNKSIDAIKGEINKAKIMTFLFPIIFAIISVLVIISTMSQLVLQERYNIGLLKSLGIKNKDIVSNYCGYGMYFCFLGALLGLIAAPLVVPNMTFEVYDTMFNLPRDVVSLNFPVLLMIGVVVVAVVLGYFSAFFVIINVAGKTPKECIDRSIKINLKSNKKSKNISKIFKIAIRNIKINLSRTIMSGFAIFGCSLLCLIGFATDEIYDNVNFSLKSFDVFAKIFKGFAIVLLILTLIIFIVQIFKDRIKEMAILRLHGEEYFKIWLTILFEMLFVCLIGLFFSMLCAQPIILLCFKYFSISKKIIISFSSYLKTFLIVVCVVCLTAVCAIKKVYKLNISDVLKNPD